MLSREELDRIAAEDEKRLGVGSEEFLQRHNEIMELIDRASGKENGTMEKVKVFRDYAEVDEKALEGFTVEETLLGINAEGTGMSLELSRKVDNVILGIDVVYNPDHEEGETPLMISNEFVRRIE